MEVTRVVFYPKNCSSESLAVCSVILDDEIRLNDIALFRNESGYYLILPSKQGVYSSILRLNTGKSISLPENTLKQDKGKKYEEFFHPIKGGVYRKILNAVVDEYEKT